MNQLKSFRKHLVRSLAVLTTMTVSTALQAQEHVLRLHHFLPAQQQNQQNVIEPWAQKIEQESGGRIKIEIYPSMQLGGKPPQLLDQVRDGLADIVWALPAYTPGRYPKIAVFELPFMISTAEATSQALQAYYEAHARDEFSDFKVLWFHVHGRGLFPRPRERYRHGGRSAGQKSACAESQYRFSSRGVRCFADLYAGTGAAGSAVQGCCRRHCYSLGNRSRL